MSNFSKIVILILIILSFFFIKEKYSEQIISLINSVKHPVIGEVQIPVINNDEEEKVQPPSEKPPVEKKEKQTATIYFLALDADDNGIYKKVTREVMAGEDKIDYAIKELLKGPNIVEKSLGAYSEIPQSTKLLGIKHKGNKIIIDLSSDFQYGGGTDSIYSRMMQLIKTAINNSDNKKIYLYLDGKQVNFLGGEGIMITQPLNENSLEV